MTMAWSNAINHQMAASAAVKVLPEPLQDLTATRLWFAIADSISRCFFHGRTPKKIFREQGWLVSPELLFAVSDCGGQLSLRHALLPSLVD